MSNPVVEAVIIARVSAKKSLMNGDSHSDQEKTTELLIKRIEAQDNVSIKIVHVYPITQSASGKFSGEFELQPLYNVLRLIKKEFPNVKYALLKSVDRQTRAGGDMALFLKKMYLSEDIKLYDSLGIIDHKTYNTLAHLQKEFWWSKKNPTDTMLYLEGERAKNEVTDILTRMIGAEITYTRLGYATMEAPYGLINTKVHTEHGKRTVWTAHPEESKYVIRIMEMSYEGFKDSEIIEAVNKMGYKSRVKNRYDSEDTDKIIGKIGGKLLDRKQLARIRENPSYAGYMKHEWLEGKLIKCQHFDGIVDIELWNGANRGKYTLVVDGKEAQMLERAKNPIRVKKDNHNPLFPFKNVVGCPVEGCGKPLSGSAPRNGSGGTTRQYHHAWNHKYWGINADKLEKQIYKLIDNIELKEKYSIALRKKMLAYWETKRGRIIDANLAMSKRLAEIEIREQSLSDKIEFLESPVAIRAMESKLNDLLVEKADIMEKKNKKQEEQVNVQVVINRVTNYLEHIGSTLQNTKDTRKLEVLFALLFEERPTVDDLYFGTAKLSCVFNLNESFLQEINAKIPDCEPAGIRTLNQ